MKLTNLVERGLVGGHLKREVVDGVRVSPSSGDGGPLATRLRFRNVSLKKRDIFFLGLFVVSIIGVTLFVATGNVNHKTSRDLKMTDPVPHLPHGLSSKTIQLALIADGMRKLRKERNRRKSTEQERATNAKALPKSPPLWVLASERVVHQSALFSLCVAPGQALDTAPTQDGGHSSHFHGTEHFPGHFSTHLSLRCPHADLMDSSPVSPPPGLHVAKEGRHYKLVIAVLSARSNRPLRDAVRPHGAMNSAGRVKHPK